MFEFVTEDNMKGYKIYIGSDVVSLDTGFNLDNMGSSLDQCSCMKIENMDDYWKYCQSYDIVKGYDPSLKEMMKKELRPIRELENKIKGRFNPVIKKRDETDGRMNSMITTFKNNTDKKTEEEMVENLKKATEREDIIKRKLANEAAEKKKIADELEAKKKAEVEKRQALEREKRDKEKNVTQVAKKIEDAKKEIKINPDKKDEIGKELGNLELQKESAIDEVKKIDTELADQKAKVKSVSTEEMSVKRDIQKITNQIDSVIVCPEPPSTRLPKVDNLTFVNLTRYKLLDINKVPVELVNIKLNDKVNRNKLLDLVPREWLDMELDNDAIRDIIKKIKDEEGTIDHDRIPGIEIYTDTTIRTYQAVRKIKEKA